VEYGLLRSLAAKGWETRVGDCGVLAALFVALCRAAGIPARWQSGWFLKPVGGNMHDWAEFWVEGLGWLPCDPTYGPIVDRDNDRDADPAVRDFFCGGIDAFRMVASAGVAAPLGGSASPAADRPGPDSAGAPDERAAAPPRSMVANNNIASGQPVPDKRWWRSEPFDFQRGEAETAARNLFFPDWIHQVRWSSHPTAG
jgi:transglutaminase-like putative cysteine protease